MEHEERKPINLSKAIKKESIQKEDQPIREMYPDYTSINYEEQLKKEYSHLQKEAQPYTQTINKPYREMEPQYSNQTYQVGQEYKNIPPVQPQNVSNPPVKKASTNYYDYSTQNQTKYCKHCGGIIPIDAVVCTICGRQVESLSASPGAQNQIYVNNSSNTSINIAPRISPKSKTVSLALNILGFFGLAGLHRLYAGKIVSGLLYLFTWGFFGVGTLIDLIKILSNTFTDFTGSIIKDN